MVIPIANGVDIEATDFTGTRRKQISAALFVGYASDAKFSGYGLYFRCSDATNTAAVADVSLPDGCSITKIKVYWNRGDAAATGTMALYRYEKANPTATLTLLASADSNASTGQHPVETTLGTPEVVDNTKYGYYFYSELNPNDSTLDVECNGCEIEFTITHPKP